MMVRVKNGSTATNFTSIALGYTKTGYSQWPDGSALGRVSGGGTSAQMYWSRATDSYFFPGTTGGYAGTCYGNTTTWYHITFAYDASNNRIRTYIDGNFVSNITCNTTVASSGTTNDFFVGAHNGKFADAAFFNRLLSDSEILSMASYRQPQVTSGLVVFWRLDSDGTDTSGNGNTGSVIGSAPNVSWSTADSPPQPESPAVALSGTAASSSGLTGSVTVSKPAAGTVTTTSGLTGNITITKPVAGTAATSSQFASAAARANVSGTQTTSSQLQGTLRADVVGSTMATTSGFTGALSQNFPLAGSAETRSQFPTAALSQVIAVSGALGTASQFPTATLNQSIAVTGTTLETSSEFQPLALTRGVPLVGNTLETSSGFAAAQLLVTKPLTANALGTESQFPSAQLLRAVPLVGTDMATSSQFQSAALVLAHALQGALTTTSGLTGSLGQDGVFSGTAVTTTEFPPPLLSVDKSLPADASATNSQLVGVLSALLEGAALQSGSSLEGTLSALLAGAGETSSSLTGALSIDRGLAGTTETASAFVAALTGRLFGQMESSSSFGVANLSVNATPALAGSATTQSDWSGTLSGGSNAAGGIAGSDGVRDRIGVAAGMSRRKVR